ncbi:methylated-DNA--[protein]-cysteine S-methyltransferase [Acinetobacter wanghuae]|uniref:Methylated-DNA--protein-cysteine methyltransferase n=1 Tax=Acinetobacter wanghuae TaxID=2662362 RepID=A0A5Q0P145_9GAMM|nr:methylated-DNA--[protein]-cysteine S-methyltransferase [Acinetobacter wanghuae]MQW93172.1 methylated-DNA--[protein]-cysteine S-methyltransferase [Acinetobacter wanghuae]QGA10402.1 methylated-DNA--[protein]-cysteine S-methyltransferase [Acinetobacter wanghuae]
MTLNYLYMHSPVGRLQLVADEQALVAVLWECEKANRVRLHHLVENQNNIILIETQKQLSEYFQGYRQRFDLPLKLNGTDFQQQVWRALLNIPYGETRTYKEIALAIGNLKAVRAVGSAIGRNPISIIAPCHRVIGADGKLVGFAGGLANKEILLNLEKTNKI